MLRQGQGCHRTCALDTYHGGVDAAEVKRRCILGLQRHGGSCLSNQRLTFLQGGRDAQHIPAKAVVMTARSDMWRIKSSAITPSRLPCRRSWKQRLPHARTGAATQAWPASPGRLDPYGHPLQWRPPRMQMQWVALLLRQILWLHICISPGLSALCSCAWFACLRCEYLQRHVCLTLQMRSHGGMP
jgi:hypothetical protein